MKPAKTIIVSVIVIALGGALLLLGLFLGPVDGIALYICIPPLLFSVHPVAGLGAILIFIGTMGLFVSFSASRLGALAPKLDLEEYLDAQDGGAPQRRGGSRPHTGIKTGGVIFLGPIPIVWGSDRRIGRTMLYIAVVITIFLILLFVLNGLMLVYGG